MKIVVIGGTGLIGSKTVQRLNKLGHNAVPASPSSGVDTISGKGLSEVLAGAEVVIDLANAPSWEDSAVMDFFTTSSKNVAAAEKAAGVKHHIGLSIVGTERLQENGYFRAKLAQEAVVKGSGVAFTLVHSTQFHEFIKGIAEAGQVGDTIRISPAYIQPIAADDVAEIVADIATGVPLNGTIDIAGPDRFRLSELVTKYFAAEGDTRQIVADVHAKYFGSELKDDSIVPAGEARLGKIAFKDWREANTKAK